MLKVVVKMCEISICLEIQTLREGKNGGSRNRRERYPKTNQISPSPLLRNTRNGRERARDRRRTLTPWTLLL
jgi:hypothetical protein